MSRPGDKALRELSELLNKWFLELNEWDSNRAESSRLPWIDDVRTQTNAFIIAQMIHLLNMRPGAVGPVLYSGLDTEV